MLLDMKTYKKDEYIKDIMRAFVVLQRRCADDLDMSYWAKHAFDLVRTGQAKGSISAGMMSEYVSVELPGKTNFCFTIRAYCMEKAPWYIQRLVIVATNDYRCSVVVDGVAYWTDRRRVNPWAWHIPQGTPTHGEIQAAIERKALFKEAI